jgi:hypothetical protein
MIDVVHTSKDYQLDAETWRWTFKAGEIRYIVLPDRVNEFAFEDNVWNKTLIFIPSAKKTA